MELIEIATPAPAPVQVSWLVFCIQLLGPYGPFFAVAVLMAVVLSAVLVVRGRGPALAPALLCIGALPLTAAMFVAIFGIIESCDVVIAADEGNFEPKPSEWTLGIAAALSSAWLAIAATAVIAVAVTIALTRQKSFALKANTITP
jgi:hypothetical protein